MKGIYLLLGSNVGDRMEHIRRAAILISQRVGGLTGWSSLYETEAWGVEDQPAFLNCVLVANSDLTPQEILDELLDIERWIGRVRYRKWGERVIDIDMLYYSDRTIDSDRLTIPHPRIADRRFALVPMSEVSPGFVHPVLHLSQSSLLEACSDPLRVDRFRDRDWLPDTAK